jgi:peroxiredoxin
MRRFLGSGVLLLCAAGFLSGAPNVGDTAPEFPPGPFTDGNSYKLSDFAGKVVVLYFFEKQ